MIIIALLICSERLFNIDNQLFKFYIHVDKPAMKSFEKCLWIILNLILSSGIYGFLKIANKDIIYCQQVFQ